MNISTVEIEIPSIENVDVSHDLLGVELSDGRFISVPLAWYPRLLHASPKERKQWRLIGKGHGVHWKDIDEDISVENLIKGSRSGESQASFKKWFANRNNRPIAHERNRAHTTRRPVLPLKPRTRKHSSLV